MAIKVTCDSCFMDFSVKDELAGKKIKCKECGEVIRVLARSGRDTAGRDEFEADDAPAPLAAPRSRPAKPKSTQKRPAKSSFPLKWVLLVGGLVFGGLGIAVVAILVLHSFDQANRNRARWENQQPVAAQPAGIPAPGTGPASPFSPAPASTPPASASPAAPAAGGPGDLFPIASLPFPKFVDLQSNPKGPRTKIEIITVNLGVINQNSRSPGFSMSMRVYLPPGEHPDKSLGCVLVAPAGSNLLTGNGVDAPDYHDETLPYVKAGYVAITYSLDGALPAKQNATDAQFANAYREFAAAYAGVANARNAFEFVLAKLPQVNPERIFAAGHSSAAVVSLLFAEHEPRLKGCIAYAAASDVEKRLAPALNDPAVPRLLSGIREFAKRSSPRTHMAHLNCPVFVFHARDDSNEPFATSERFVGDLKQLGKKVTFEQTPRGDHYDSMIKQGIPKAIAWLKALPGESGG